MKSAIDFSSKTVKVMALKNEKRLDSMLSSQTTLSRTALKRLIEKGCVYKQDEPNRLLSADMRVWSGDIFYVRVPPPDGSKLVAEDVDFDIVFEDEDIVVVNKPANLVVHPAPGHKSGTLVHGLLKKCHSLSGVGGIARPGIVHRLDKGTSGLMIVAKTDEAHQSLAKQLQNRTLGRFYQALIWGVLQPSSGSIEAPLGRHPCNRKKQTVKTGGRFAKTFYKTAFILNKNSISHIICRLLTGRTHQIRVHFAHKGKALLGDPLYGKQTSDAKKKALSVIWPHDRPALHASHLYFVHPRTQKRQFFSTPFPEDWKHLELSLAEPRLYFPEEFLEKL